MDLNIKNYEIFNIGGVEVWLTETIVNTWIIMGVLILFAIIARIALKNFDTIPKGFQNVVELIVETFVNFTRGSVGSNLMYLGPWFFSVFAFILSSALFSVFGLRAPTADWSTTFALALASFLIMIYGGLRGSGLDYLKGFFSPHPLFLPINLIGELAKPISLSFRLFGNMLSGTIILTLYYGLTPLLVQIGIPAALHAFFDVIFGAIQTYIFVIISMMYVKEAAGE